MASRMDSNNRQWTVFWSCIDKDGNRYRHQVRKTRPEEGNRWLTRTQVWPNGEQIHYTVSVELPKSHGEYLWTLVKAWSNVDEEGREMYPPEYQSGFKNLGERNAE